jgi:hypothetical protein
MTKQYFSNLPNDPHYLAVQKTELTKYMPYLFDKFATTPKDSINIFNDAADNDTFVIPKSLIRASTAKLNTDLFPTGGARRYDTKLYTTFHNFYEDDKLTGYLNMGSFEGDPLSTGDGDLSFGFSLRNLDGGTILSTGAEITSETGIFAELVEKENDCEHPIDPFNWGLNVTIKSRNYEYKLNDLNFYRSTNILDDEYEEYKRMGFGIFRQIPSMQRPPELKYDTLATKNLGAAHALKNIYDAKNASSPLSAFDPYGNNETQWFGDYFTYGISGTKATLKDQWLKSRFPKVTNANHLIANSDTRGITNQDYITTKWLDYNKWNWTNILVTKKEEIEYIKVPIFNQDILDYELLLDDEDNPITNYLDAKIWLLNHIEDAIEETGNWNGDITVRPKTNSAHDAYETDVINRMDVYASYKHDDDKIDYILLGSVNGAIANYSEGDNTNFYLGKANNSNPYYMGHLKDVGVWYKYMDIIDIVTTNLLSDRSSFKLVSASKSIISDETIIRNVLTNPTTSVSTKYYIIKHYNDGTNDYVVTDAGNTLLSGADLDFDALIEFDNQSLFTQSNGVQLTEMIDLIRYTDVQYVLDYERNQYLSDLALNVKTTKWTKYPFKISYNPPTQSTQIGDANITWYNRTKANFAPVTYPKEQILNNKGYRGWQSKILLKL